MKCLHILMLSVLFCLANAKCSDNNDDVSINSNSTINKILNSTSTLVNKLQSTTSKSISNNSTTNTSVDNKIVTTPRCLCNSASRI